MAEKSSTAISTKTSVKPRRSVLYMPANNERAITKAQTLAADVIVFDLEDAVAPEQKAIARDTLKQHLPHCDYGQRELLLRINAEDTEWHQADLQFFVELAVDGVVIPKVASANAVQRVATFVSSFKETNGFSIWPMIETPAGVINVRDIVHAHPSIDCLLMGTSDLAKELRLPGSVDRAGLLHALSQCVLAACEKRIDVVDGVCLDLQNESVLNAQLEQGRALGFTGKSLIHPKQLAPCNSIFGITQEQRLLAERIVQAWREAEAKESALVVLDGQLIESLHVEDAVRCLTLAEAIEKRGY